MIPNQSSKTTPVQQFNRAIAFFLKETFKWTDKLLSEKGQETRADTRQQRRIKTVSVRVRKHINRKWLPRRLPKQQHKSYTAPSIKSTFTFLFLSYSFLFYTSTKSWRVSVCVSGSAYEQSQTGAPIWTWFSLACLVCLAHWLGPY